MLEVWETLPHWRCSKLPPPWPSHLSDFLASPILCPLAAWWLWLCGDHNWSPVTNLLQLPGRKRQHNDTPGACARKGKWPFRFKLPDGWRGGHLCAISGLIRIKNWNHPANFLVFLVTCTHVCVCVYSLKTLLKIIKLKSQISNENNDVQNILPLVSILSWSIRGSAFPSPSWWATMTL